MSQSQIWEQQSGVFVPAKPGETRKCIPSGDLCHQMMCLIQHGDEIQKAQRSDIIRLSFEHSALIRFNRK